MIIDYRLSAAEGILRMPGFRAVYDVVVAQPQCTVIALSLESWKYPTMSTNGNQLSEQLIQDSFHSYLKSSLTQAKTERLLDVDVLSSAEGDLMITGSSISYLVLHRN